MFGAYRYLLALLTIFSHFHPIYFGKLNWVGMYGLFGFYVMSGYLMTRALHEAYGFTGQGVTRFLWNRALRVYPTYWLSAILALLVVFLVPDTIRLYSKVMDAPTTAIGILANVFVLGLHAGHGPRIVTPAWSLHVELCFYGLMALGLSRSRWTVAAWFVASIGYVVYAVHAGLPFSNRYDTVAAASLPFSAGAAIYFLARPGGAPRKLALPLVALFVVGNLFAPFLVRNVLLDGFYTALAVTAVIVYCLAHVETRKLPARLQRLDRWLGDLTYPMFLLHFPVSFVIVALISPNARLDQTLMLLLGLPAVHLVAWAVVVLVEHRVQPTRERIRGRRLDGYAAAFQPAFAGPQLAARTSHDAQAWPRAVRPARTRPSGRPTNVVPFPGIAQASPSNPIAEVESLRGIATALVYLLHAESYFSALRAFAAPISPFRAYIIGGHTGVSLFFILSGFLLARPFLVDAAGGARVSASRFYARRALRIMPLYVAMIVVATVTCAKTAADLLHGIPFLFFLNSVEGWAQQLPPFSWVWWSLATEAQFYLVLPALPFLLRSPRGRRIGLVLLVAYAVAYAAFATGYLRTPTSQGQNRLAHSLFGRAPLFACGIFAAAFHHWFGGAAKTWAARQTWVRYGGADVVLLGVILALGLLLRHVIYGNYFELESHRPAWHLIEGPLWTSIVLLLLLAPLRSKLLFSNPVLGLLGRLSYSVYLVHVPVMLFGLRLMDRTFGWKPAGWTLESMSVCAVFAAVCLAISAVTYALIERPMMRYRRRGRLTRDEQRPIATEAPFDAAAAETAELRRRATA